MREGARALQLTQMAWMAWLGGTSGDYQGIQLADNKEKQTRLANHSDEREKQTQAQQSLMVREGPRMAERKL